LGRAADKRYSLDAMGLDTVELILEAEKHFGVSVPDERAEKTETVEKFARLLCELSAQTETPLPYDDVLLQLQQMIAKMFKIPIERIVPEARFVQDLRLDQ
jgi:acyl carrier protein